jgi:predicted nuclease of predicted toxin-antitoxin system
LKFLIDAQLPPALAEWLRGKGHDAVSVRDIGLREADDMAIWTHALAAGAVIVTKDEDFAFLAARQAGPAVLWVRTGNLVTRMLLMRFESAWAQTEAYSLEGTRLVELR